MVSVFILSYNSPNKLIKTIESCLVQPEINEYLMIENASTDAMDETYAEIEKKVTQKGHAFKLKREKETISFSAGQNWGLDTAKNETVLLLNNDAFFLKENSLHAALTCLEPKEVGLVGFKILNPNGTINHFGVVFSPHTREGQHFLRGRNKNIKNSMKPTQFYAVTAACVLVKKSDIRFSNDYWFEWEDIDFCLQHIKKGKKIICDVSCLVEHDEGSSRSKKQIPGSTWCQKQRYGTQQFKKKWAYTIYKLWILDSLKTLADKDLRYRLWVRTYQLLIYIGLALGVWYGVSHLRH